MGVPKSPKTALVINCRGLMVVVICIFACKGRGSVLSLQAVKEVKHINIGSKKEVSRVFNCNVNIGISESCGVLVGGR